jgi:hypothetical protein
LALGRVVRGHFVLRLRATFLSGLRRSHSSLPARRRAQPARERRSRTTSGRPQDLSLMVISTPAGCSESGCQRDHFAVCLWAWAVNPQLGGTAPPAAPVLNEQPSRAVVSCNHVLLQVSAMQALQTISSTGATTLSKMTADISRSPFWHGSCYFV